MRQIARMIAVSLPVSPLAAPEWRALSEDDAQAALKGRELVYGSSAWQEFRTSGRTVCNAGRDSRGYWDVRDGKY
ncbi:hypothetical protein METH_08040 [Leisingera methylohalidivorans DSM 14336]|uniref:Uncharacterized protein n=1 Tax=Leisingera methylohalidivorans DSM 14336 TaxID=999552 RepID=V9W030_9RHOB|nr:hypothetical protein METH_08040 [Leisingera methylohalidivorans DSM 14336]